jgi:hypothetical protein
VISFTLQIIYSGIRAPDILLLGSVWVTEPIWYRLDPAVCGRNLMVAFSKHEIITPALIGRE